MWVQAFCAVLVAGAALERVVAEDIAVDPATTGEEPAATGEEPVATDEDPPEPHPWNLVHDPEGDINTCNLFCGTYTEYSNGSGYCDMSNLTDDQQEICENVIKAFGSLMAALIIGPVILCCCCLCCLIACCYFCRRRKKSKRGTARHFEDDSDYDSVPLNENAWMSTGCPQGCSWAQYLAAERPYSDKSGMLAGRWGECLAWAAVYEYQNPNWKKEARFRVGTGVVGAVIEELPERLAPAGEALEAACRQAFKSGGPCPLIGYQYRQF